MKSLKRKIAKAMKTSGKSAEYCVGNDSKYACKHRDQVRGIFKDESPLHDNK